MAHKILDSGTAYEITGGKVMDAGTVYDIDHGNLMDAGTVYEIPFQSISGHQLTSIHASGTQYINTGYKPNGSTRVVMDCSVNNFLGIPTIFGAWNAANSNMFVWCGSGKWFLMYDASTEYANWNPAAGVRRLHDANKNVWSIDGNVLNTFSAGTFSVNYPLFLCAYNNAGSVANYTPMDLYSCQIYDNGTIVRDYIPWQMDDGQIGLLDRVNGVFYGNAGSGSFTGT